MCLNLSQVTKLQGKIVVVQKNQQYDNMLIHEIDLSCNKRMKYLGLIRSIHTAVTLTLIRVRPIGASPQGSVGILIPTRVGAWEVTQNGLHVTKTAPASSMNGIVTGV